MIDFHCHSSASDGACSPCEVARLVKEAGLGGFALTDHDTARGVLEAKRAAERHGIVFIPGVELTGYHEECEWHIQALFIGAEPVEVDNRLKPFVRRRRERMMEMLDGLRSAGIDIAMEEIEEEAGEGVVGRMHLASVMVKKGFVKRHRDAYRTYIGDGAPFYVPKLRFAVVQAIDLAIELGGVPVLAHPGIPGRDHCIPFFVARGLVGLEAFTPKHTYARQQQYARMAGELGLVATAGSDYHGKSYENAPGASAASEEVMDLLLERKEALSRG